MPSATYTLGADTSSAEKKVKEFRQKLRETNELILEDAKKMQERLNRQNGQTPYQRGFRGVGNASLQLQDIAVQMEQGTKAGTIMMQQGTQLLSVFGPGGMIAGGVLGLGLLIYNTMNSSSEAIKKLKIEAGEMTLAFNKTMNLGTMEAFSSYVDKAAESVSKLKQQAEDLKTSGVFENLMTFMGGQFGLNPLATKAGENRIEAMQPFLAQAFTEQVRMLNVSNEMLDVSEKELEILKLKAAGNETLATQKENEIKMQRELDAMWETAAAKNSAAYANQQDANIREKYALNERIRENKEEKEAAEKAAKEKDEAQKKADRAAKDAADEKRKTEDDIQRQIRESQDRSAQEAKEIVDRQLEKEKNAIAEIQKAKEEAANEDEKNQKRIDAVREKQIQSIENQLTLEQRMALAKERVRNTQEKAQAFRNVNVRNVKAEADLAEAQGGLQDVREEQIQRIMGGSTSAAAAQRAERREQRARARAERILQKRQDIRDMDAKARGEWAKPAEMNLQGGPQKDPVEAAVKEGNTMLGKVEQQLKDLNQRLTVA